MLTILPDYLIRRFIQGKRITFFSVWYELRWGITLCVILTLLLITTIFYFHPATTSAISLFRTVPILPETNGRISEIYVPLSGEIEKGKPIFKLDSTEQQATLEVAKRRIAEVDAQQVMAQADMAAAQGQVQQAQGALKQYEDELRTKLELQKRASGTVALREIERLQTAVDGSKGQLAAAEASRQAAETKSSTLLPAQKASAEAQLQQAQVELNKMVVYAGVSGRVEQFTLRVGDIVNPVMRPGGLLIPSGAGQKSIQAGFGQIEAQIIKVGMAAEATCVSKPLKIIPLVVTGVQDYIAAGQVRASDQLLDVQNVTKPGTILAFLQPLYEDGLDGLTPGSSCIVNAYTSNHERLVSGEDIPFLTRTGLHVVDTVALVHAMILRVQALLLPTKTLVLGGH